MHLNAFLHVRTTVPIFVNVRTKDFMYPVFNHNVLLWERVKVIKLAEFGAKIESFEYFFPGDNHFRIAKFVVNSRNPCKII